MLIGVAIAPVLRYVSDSHKTWANMGLRQCETGSSQGDQTWT